MKRYDRRSFSEVCRVISWHWRAVFSFSGGSQQGGSRKFILRARDMPTAKKSRHSPLFNSATLMWASMGRPIRWARKHLSAPST